MLERTRVRVLPFVNRAADAAPMTTACCNACRTCVQTNLLGIAVAGATGAVSVVRRFTRRFAEPS